MAALGRVLPVDEIGNSSPLPASKPTDVSCANHVAFRQAMAKTGHPP
jgi:hypothetical protein